MSHIKKSLDENPNNGRALYDRAIAADSYFKDLEARINYYYELYLKNPKNQILS